MKKNWLIGLVLMEMMAWAGEPKGPTIRHQDYNRPKGEARKKMSECSETDFQKQSAPLTNAEFIQNERERDKWTLFTDWEEPYPRPYAIVAKIRDPENDNRKTMNYWTNGSWGYSIKEEKWVDSAYRMALAQSLLCLLDNGPDANGFLTGLQGFLGKHHFPEEDISGNYNLPFAVTLLNDLSGLTKYPEPKVKDFLKAVYEQILGNEENLMHRPPLTLRLQRAFEQQIAYIAKLLKDQANGGSLSREEVELLKFVKEFIKEPRFSYLLHPLVSNYVMAKLNGEKVTPNLHGITKTVVHGEVALRKALGSSVDIDFGSNAKRTQGRIGNTGIAEIPDWEHPVIDAVNKAVDKIRFKPGIGKPQVVEKLTKMRSELAGLMEEAQIHTGIEGHAYRRALKTATAQLDLHIQQVHKDGEIPLETVVGIKNAVEETMEGPTASADRMTFDWLQKQVGAPYSLAALAEYRNFDPVSKRMVQEISHLDLSNYPHDKKNLAKFLQTGASTDLFKAILDSEYLPKYVSEALFVTSSTRNTMEPLTRLLSKKIWTKADRDEYQKLRSSLLRGEPPLNQALSKTENKDRYARALMIALLDEKGLSGVTPKDEISPENPRYYHAEAVVKRLAMEEAALKQVAKESGKSLEQLESELYSTAFDITDRFTGIPSEGRIAIATRPKGAVELLKFAKLKLKGIHGPNLTQGQRSLEKLAFGELTEEKAGALISAQGRPETLAYLPGAEADAAKEAWKDISGEAIDELHQRNFFRYLPGYLVNYREYRNASEKIYGQLSHSLLDHVRLARLNLPKETNRETVNKINMAISLLEYIGQSRDRHPLVVAIAKFLRSPIPRDQPALMMRFGDLPKETLQQAIEGLLYLYPKPISSELLSRYLDPLAKAEGQWLYILSHMGNLSEEAQTAAHIILQESLDYERAIDGAKMASLRDEKRTGSPSPSIMDELIENRWSAFSEAITKKVENSETNNSLKGFLTLHREWCHKEASVRAASDAKKFDDSILKLTDPKGKFAQYHIGYDPLENTLLIRRDTYLDKDSFNLLLNLGPAHRLKILNEDGTVIEFEQASHGLEEWIRSKYFDAGEVLLTAIERKDYKPPYIRLTDETAVQVVRKADGSYEYNFTPMRVVEQKLKEAYDKHIELRRADYDAKLDVNGYYHNAKVSTIVVGDVILTGCPPYLLGRAVYQLSQGRPTHALGPVFKHLIDRDPQKDQIRIFGIPWREAPETSERNRLSQLEKERQKLLPQFYEAGQAKVMGKSGFTHHREFDELYKSLLKQDEAAIEKHLANVEFVNELVFLIATSALAWELEGPLLAMAQGAGRSAMAARALFYAAQAAKHYRTVMMRSAWDAAKFTGASVGTDMIGQAVGMFGQGPAIVRAKLDAYEEVKKGNRSSWRKWRPGVPPTELEVLGKEGAENLSKADREKYNNEVYEWEIEEALDPDGDGVPNNHSSWDKKANRRGYAKSWNELTGSAPHHYMANLESFAAMGMVGRGPVVDMAAAGFARRFKDTNERIFEKRQKGETPKSYLEEYWDETKKGVPQDLVAGGLFSAAGLPAKGVTKLAPKSLGATTTKLLSTFTFVLSDRALKEGQRYVTDPSGYRWEFDWKEIPHDIALGAFVGWDMSKHAYEKQRYNVAKERLGISKEANAKLYAKPAGSLDRVLKEEFKGNRQRELHFLRSIKPEEIAKAPDSVRSEFFARMVGIGGEVSTGLSRFAAQTRDPKQLAVAKELGELVAKITALNRQATASGLSPEEASALHKLKVQQLVLVENLNRFLEQKGEAANAADRRLNRWTAKVTGSRDETKDRATIREYHSLLDTLGQALSRIELVDHYQRGIETTTAVLSPESAFGKEYLQDYPKATKALEALKESQLPHAMAANAYKFLDLVQVVPHVPEVTEQPGYLGQRSRAIRQLETALIQAKDSDTKSELTEILNEMKGSDTTINESK